MSSSEPLPIRPHNASDEGYSHDATLAAITSFLEYVSEVYGEGYELSYPPPGAGRVSIATISAYSRIAADTETA
ncbi:hypothetical protein PG990_004063 [Apiospora arundinis]